MRKTRFGEERIIGVPGEREAGTATVDACRRHGNGEERTFGLLPTRLSP